MVHSLSILLLFSPLLLSTLPIILTQQPIPGCVDIDNLEATFDLESTSLEELLLCFCKSRLVDRVSINCLYGSTLADLNKAIGLVKSVNRTVDRIMLNHMDFGEKGLEAGIFEKMGAQLTEINIGLCAQTVPLMVHSDAFRGLETTLKNLSLYECQMERVPEAIRALPRLERLSLSGNKISSIIKVDLASFKELQVLNLGSNFLSNIEPGTLNQLPKLNTLILGPRNYMNDSIVEEIKMLKSLKILDLSQMNGLSDIPPGMLTNLTNLRKFLLSGNNLVNLTNDMFKEQSNLEELDLRVNLIEKIEPDTFASLGRLKKLWLAGNYLSQLTVNQFNGMDTLEELDLGWNEFKTISTRVFFSLGDLRILDLRHNQMLKEFEPDAFAGLINLQRLNLSETDIRQLERHQLSSMGKLRFLDLTRSNLNQIEAGAFDRNRQLRRLSLRGSKLNGLPSTLFDSLVELQELDLSGNPWLCDDRLAPVINFVNKMKAINAEKDRPFFLKNVNGTMCARPYDKQKKVITKLDVMDLKPYDIDTDTTSNIMIGTTKTMSATAPEQKTTPQVLENAKVTTTLEGKSEHISSDKEKKRGKSRIPLVVVSAVLLFALLTICVIIGVLCYMKSPNRERSGMEFRDDRPTPKETTETEMSAM